MVRRRYHLVSRTYHVTGHGLSWKLSSLLYNSIICCLEDINSCSVFFQYYLTHPDVASSCWHIPRNIGSQYSESGLQSFQVEHYRHQFVLHQLLLIIGSMYFVYDLLSKYCLHWLNWVSNLHCGFANSLFCLLALSCCLDVSNQLHCFFQL